VNIHGLNSKPSAEIGLVQTLWLCASRTLRLTVSLSQPWLILLADADGLGFFFRRLRYRALAGDGLALNRLATAEKRWRLKSLQISENTDELVLTRACRRPDCQAACKHTILQSGCTLSSDIFKYFFRVTINTNEVAKMCRMSPERDNPLKHIKTAEKG